MSESSYKVYASKEYVDQKTNAVDQKTIAPGSPYQMVITNMDGQIDWADQTHGDYATKYSVSTIIEASSGNSRSIDCGTITYKLGEKIYIQTSCEGGGSTFHTFEIQNTDVKKFMVGGSPAGGGTLEFMLTEASETDAYNVILYVSGTVNEEVSVEVYSIYNTIKRIDPKFLPEDYINNLIEAKAELPPVTAENNGAILQVIDGKWTAVQATTTVNETGGLTFNIGG